MGKELFDQPLISSPNEPDDADRLGFGQPGVAGGKNMLWSRFKEIINGFISLFTSVKFDVNNPPTVTQEGELFWNGEFHTLEFDTGLGGTPTCKVTIGNQEYTVFYNDTGVELPPGKNMHLLSGFVLGGQLYPTFEFADPRDSDKVQGTLGMTMHTVPIASLGLLADRAQEIKGVNTSGVGAGVQLYIKPDGSGDITDIVPQWPNIPISIGGSYNSQVDGSVFYNVTSDSNQLFNNAWDGSIIEGFDFTVSSDGVTVTGLLENKDNARDLKIKFSTSGPNFYNFDTTTTPATIPLIAGSDELHETNYVYILESTKALTVSTAGWPILEHAKVARLEVQSAATVQTDGGAYRNQNINDHLKTTGDNGHIPHIAERIRQFNAEWDNGVEATFDNTGGNGYIVTTAGQAWQLHKQDLPAQNMALGDVGLVVNDFTTAYRRTTNLASITAYSGGTSWNNEWSKIVVWRVANKTGEPSLTFVNIPSDGYNSEANAIADALNYASFSIPDKYKGVGFLVASFVVRISGGVITYNGGSAYADLRGFIPNNVAGGGGGGGGVTSFSALTDTPNSYIGQAGKVATVNAGESALEYTEIHENTPILFWQYNDSTLDIDPGLSKFLIGSGFLNISISLFNSGGDVGNTLANIKNGSTLYIQSRTNSQLYKSINVTGDAINNTSYYKIPINIVDEDSPLILNDIIGINIFPIGGSAISILKTFTQAVSINNILSHYADYSQTGVLNFTKSASTFLFGLHQFKATTNGDDINFTSDFIEVRNDYKTSGNKIADYDFKFKLGYDGKIRVWIYDLAGVVTVPALQVQSVSTTSLNQYIDVTFNTGVYGAGDGATRTLFNDWNIGFIKSTGALVKAEIHDVTKLNNERLEGGETQIRFHIYAEGLANGDETIEISPKLNAIYNLNGVAMLTTETTGVQSLVAETTIDPIGRTRDVSFYLDAKDSSTIDEITDFDFTDKTLNQLLFSQSTPANKPANNVGSIGFGDSQFLVAPEPVFLSSEGFSIFFAINRTANADDILISSSDTFKSMTITNRLAYILLRNTSVYVQISATNAIIFPVSLGTGDMLIEFRNDGLGNWELFKNGVSQDSQTQVDTNAKATSFDTISFDGAGQWFNGDLYSMCIYNAKDSDTRSFIEAFMTDKYINGTITSIPNRTIFTPIIRGISGHGDSNMGGRGQSFNLSPSNDYLLNDINAFLYNAESNDFAVKIPYKINDLYAGEEVATRFSIEAQILYRLHQDYGRGFYVKTGKGSSTLDVTYGIGLGVHYWGKNATAGIELGLYLRSLVADLFALQSLRSKVYNVDYVGVVMLILSNDAADQTAANNSESNLNQYKSDKRADMGIADLKFFTYNSNGPDTYTNVVNTGMANSASSDINHTHSTFTNGVSQLPDNVHYDADGLVTISDHVYDNYINI